MYLIRKVKERLSHYRRIFRAYTSKKSNVFFWHTYLGVEEISNYKEIDIYYMDFTEKVNYKGPYDKDGIPMLDYMGNIGVRYNPCAVAQYALGAYNLLVKTKDEKYKKLFLAQADWFIRTNKNGRWEYDFDWGEYQAPWISGLSQSQGISVLVRAYELTKNESYRTVIEKAFDYLKKDINDGGVVYKDLNGDIWLEEMISSKPTHVLNGFIWSIWGVYDYYLLTKDNENLQMFNDYTTTIKNNLNKYDLGFWSLYDLSNSKIKMITSSYYHSLHITQLKIMYKLTNDYIFKEYADKWEKHYNNKAYKFIALIWKIVYKLIYY